MRRKTKVWLYGIGTAAIHSACTAFSAVVVAPGVFNLSRAGVRHLLELVLLPAGLAVVAKLSQSPLPPLDDADSTNAPAGA